jgi:hypothetical protein
VRAFATLSRESGGGSGTAERRAVPGFGGVVARDAETKRREAAEFHRQKAEAELRRLRVEHAEECVHG